LHLNNDMSWETLANKRIEHADGSSEPYFTQEEMRAGMALASQALSESEKRDEDKKQAPTRSPGETAQSSEATVSKKR